VILVRDVFQAKYGKGDELVQLFKEIFEMIRAESGGQEGMIMTDLSGPFFTVVTERKVESLEAFFAELREGFSRPEFGEWFAKTIPLIESGRREFYTIEGEA
jgi:quinol monooxygenase YgiN